jgi:hypothetical protein
MKYKMGSDSPLVSSLPIISPCVGSLAAIYLQHPGTPYQAGRKRPARPRELRGQSLEMVERLPYCRSQLQRAMPMERRKTPQKSVAHLMTSKEIGTVLESILQSLPNARPLPPDILSKIVRDAVLASSTRFTPGAWDNALRREVFSLVVSMIF